jgi:hypothetical protein
MKPALAIDGENWQLQRQAAQRINYDLTVHAGERRLLGTAWLVLAIGALLASGVFSVLLVAARTPGIAAWLPGIDFFRVALVVHVDLSVLVWFAACAGMLWSIAGTERWLGIAWIGWGLALIGSMTLAVAPFVDSGAAVMANYVPVLDSTTFMAGLVIFGSGFGLTAMRALAVPEKVGAMLAPEGALRFGLNTAAVAAAMALLALVWSSFALPRELPAKAYYEVLFWGPGHVAQFCWSLLMLVAWLWLAALIGARVPLSPRVVALLLAIGLVSVFATPVIYLAWDIASVEFQRLFTWQMRFGGGLAIVPVTAALIIALVRSPPVAPALKPVRAALIASVLLFAIGGLIGFLIRGSDVRIPAHYHGSIVGITLALMGLAYALLPRLGFAAPSSRAAAWQPWIYGGGQLLHITGLVWSGGYGVQRKVAGVEQVLRTPGEIAGMGLMGLGGLIAVIGGMLFVVIVVRALVLRGLARREAAA